MSMGSARSTPPWSSVLRGHRTLRQPGCLRLFNGTAPVERSSGGRIVHRLSKRGNRKGNHALHMVAVTQIRNPGTVGRIYFERKVAEGKTKREALRSLKRQISNAAYRQLLLDAG